MNAIDAVHARRYIRSTLGWSLVLYAMLLCALGGLARWQLWLIPLVYVRLALGLHELLHVCSAAQVPAFHRWAPIFDTPLGLGYRELRLIHRQHHRWSSGEHDPERFQIVGSHAQAFVNALLVPERTFLHWVLCHGVSSHQIAQLILRTLLFVVLAALNPTVFLMYWAMLRLSIGASSFIFHHLLHARDGQYGTFALPAPTVLMTLGRWLFGNEPMDILIRHREHHLWPRLRVWELPELPRHFVLPPGLLSRSCVDQAHAIAQRKLPT
ncbi:fatty acid desaturase [Leptothrix ochracea]|uniref:fatty acid desaturase n=1 Tax=Leptothrix ochracea TaxID=735331 RepID=UPI0034E19987